MNRDLWTRDYSYSVVQLLFLHLGPCTLLAVISVYAMSLTGSNTAAGFMTSVFPLAGLAGRFLSARLLDRFAPKRVIVASTSLLVLASALYLACKTYAMALVLRALQGLGYCIAVTALSTHVVDILAPEHRLEGIGYSSLTANICSMFGPTIAFALLGPKTNRFAWLFAFAFAAATSSLAMALFMQGNKRSAGADTAEDVDTPKASIDWVRALLPVAVLFLASGAFSASSSFLSLFAIAKGIEGIGLYFTINAIGLFASRFVMGRIVKAMGERASVILSIAVAALCFAGIAASAYTWQLYVLAVPFGFANGMLNPLVNAHMLKVLPPSKSGLANALFFAAGDAGFIVFPTVWGALAGITSYETMFVSAAAVLCCSAALALAAGFDGKAAAV